MSHCYCEVARLSRKLLFCRRLLLLFLSWLKPSALCETRLQVTLVTVFIKSKLGTLKTRDPMIPYRRVSRRLIWTVQNQQRAVRFIACLAD